MDQPRKGYKNSPFRKGTRIHMDNTYNRSGSVINNGTKVQGLSIVDGIITRRKSNARIVMDFICTENALTIVTGKWLP